MATSLPTRPRQARTRDAHAWEPAQSRQLATGCVLAVAVLVVPWLPGAHGPMAPATSGAMTATPSPSHVQAASGGSCSKPASVLIPLVGPSGTAQSGDTLTMSYEMEVSHGSTPIIVYLPRIWANFPLAGGGNYALSVGPNTQSSVGTTWTAASSETVSHTFTGPESFSSGSNALLTSELIAVQAGVTSYQGWTLSMRWSWTLTTAGGTIVSPWSGHTVYNNCPSDFYPAPRVALLQDWNTTGPPGTTFTAELSGFVANQYFFNELETPSGVVIYSHGQYAGASNVTNVTITYSCWCGHITPGPYLAHIHNVQGSLLWSLSVLVTNPDGLNANASADDTAGYVPLSVNFTATPTPGVPPYSYAWTFGDGATSSLQDPQHTYTGPGDFYANLTITDGNHEVAASSLKIVAALRPPPLSVVIGANVTAGSVPLHVHFASTVSGGTPPYNYLWAFGANLTSDLAQPNMTFYTPGLYVVTLNLTDHTGLTQEQFLDLLVHPASGGFRISLSPASGHHRVPASLTLHANVTGGAPPYNITWSFGDGTPTADGADANHSWAIPGNYSVTVVATDALGDTVNRSNYYIVYAPLTVRIPAAAGGYPVGQPIHLTAVVLGGGPNLSYRWTLNGVPEAWNFSNVSFLPNTTGSYILSVHVTDKWGDGAIASVALAVVPVTNPPPPPPGDRTIAGLPIWAWALGIAVIAGVTITAIWFVRRRPEL